jgi:putative spermidine/putrescine transport system permease protein
MLTRPSPVVIVLGGLVLFYLIFPNLIIVPMSFSSAPHFQFPPPGFSLQWYAEFFGDPRWIDSLFVSLRVGVMATLLSVVFGTGAAFGVARGRLPLPGVVRALLMAPLITPYVVMAAGIYILYVRLRLVDTELGLAMAHTLLGIPVVMIAVTASMRAARRDLELAAMSLGATPWQTFAKVTLPLVRPGILTGAIFAFITSFDEVIIAIFITGVRSKTLPMKMWDGVRTEISPVLTAVATILICLSIAVLLVVELGRRRRDRRPREAAV